MKITCPMCKRRIRIRRGEEYICKCGKSLDYKRFFHKKLKYDVYLVDANVFIYAINRDKFRGKVCNKVLSFSSENIKIGTTEDVLTELGKSISSIDVGKIKVYKINRINEKLKDLKTSTLKQPSKTDLSLIQAAIEHIEIKGLITYDKDFGNIAASGIIGYKSGRKFWIGNAKDFLGKYEVKIKMCK